MKINKWGHFPHGTVNCRGPEQRPLDTGGHGPLHSCKAVSLRRPLGARVHFWGWRGGGRVREEKALSRSVRSVRVGNVGPGRPVLPPRGCPYPRWLATPTASPGTGAGLGLPGLDTG